MSKKQKGRNNPPKQVLQAIVEEKLTPVGGVRITEEDKQRAKEELDKVLEAMEELDKVLEAMEEAKATEARATLTTVRGLR